MNQLAAAYEQQVISRGSQVHLVVDCEEGEPPVVRIQVKDGEKRMTGVSLQPRTF